MTSAVSGPTRTRARLPTGTIEDTGRAGGSAPSRPAARGRANVPRCTTSRPDRALRRSTTRRRPVEHDLRQAVRAGVRVTRQEVAAAQARDERVRRSVDEILRRPRLDEPTGDEDADPVRERGRVLEVVGDEQRRETILAENLLELGADLLARVRVECGQRLVEEQHPGPARERAGERDPLPLAARELARARRREVRDAEPLEELVDPVAPPKATFSATLRCGKRA